MRAYSEFNHHLSGLFVLFMGGLPALDAAGFLRPRWLRLWPMSLLLLGGYLVVWSDRMAWPIGPLGLLDSLSDGEILQHKLYAVILLAMGSLERARLRARSLRWGSPAFFALLVFAGLLMFHHSLLMGHNHHSPKLLFNHMVLGVLTLASASVKLLWEMRWMTWRHGGLLWPASVLAVGVLLVVYTE
jgi:putative copper resistance protein D